MVVVPRERGSRDLIGPNDPRSGIEAVIVHRIHGPILRSRQVRQTSGNAVSRRLLDLERVRVGELHPGRHVVDARLDARRHAYTTVRERVPALGEDLHDAVRRVGAVERGRGRALHDLHALDVFARDVREAEARDHAVDDDERILPPADARRTAEPERRLTTRLRRIGDQADAGDLALDGGQRALPRHGLQLIRADARDGHRQLAAVGGLRDARHDHFFEPQRIAGELEVLLLFAGAEGHGARDRLVPDVARGYHDRLAVHRGRADRQRVGPVGRGDGAEVRARHHDVRAAEGLTALRGDLALDDRFLRGQRHGAECECCECCGHTTGQQRTKLGYAHKLPLV